MKLKSMDFSMMRDKKYRKKLLYDMVSFVMIYIMLELVAIYSFGKIVGGEPSLPLFILTLPVALVPGVVVLQKRARRPKGIIALMIVCIITLPFTLSAYSILNSTGATKGQPQMVFTGRVVEVHHRPFLKDGYDLVSINGERCTVYTDEKLNVDNEPVVERYEGNFSYPIYVIESVK